LQRDRASSAALADRRDPAFQCVDVTLEFRRLGHWRTGCRSLIVAGNHLEHFVIAASSARQSSAVMSAIVPMCCV
jgi:hypothetical protein